MPFGLYNAAANFHLPDLGISEKLSGYTTRPQQTFNAPYGFKPSPIEQNLIRYGATPQYQSPIGPQPQQTSLFNSVLNTYQNNPSLPIGGSQPRTSPTAPRINTTTGTSNTGNVAGTRTTPTGGLTPEQQQALDEQAYIDATYQGTLDLLNSQRSNLQNQYGQSRDYYQNYFNPQYEQLDQARQSALGRNQFAQAQQGQQKQSAFDLASNQFGELTQKNQQIYGGSSSAGQFGNEFLGRELQRGYGQANNAYATNIAQLQQQAGDIEQNYQANRQAIDQQKNQTLLQLQQDFENSLQAIDQQQTSITGSKQTDKYNALKAYNEQKASIEQQHKSLLEQLGASALQTQQQIQAQLINYAAQANKTPDLGQINALTSGLAGSEYKGYLPGANESNQVVDTGFLQRLRKQALS